MKGQNSKSDKAVLRFLGGDWSCRESVDFLMHEVHNTRDLWVLAKMMKESNWDIKSMASMKP